MDQAVAFTNETKYLLFEKVREYDQSEGCLLASSHSQETTIQVPWFLVFLVFRTMHFLIDFTSLICQLCELTNSKCGQSYKTFDKSLQQGLSLEQALEIGGR